MGTDGDSATIALTGEPVPQTVNQSNCKPRDAFKKHASIDEQAVFPF